MTTDADRALSPVPSMQLATGFWASKTLAVAHELDLFSQLSGTPGTTPAGLAEALAIDQRPAEMPGDPAELLAGAAGRWPGDHLRAAGQRSPDRPETCCQRR